MHHSLGHLSLALSLTSTIACVPMMEEAGQTAQATVCPIEECGGNAAIAGFLRVGEGHIATAGPNQPNAWGVRLVRYAKPSVGGNYTLSVENGQFQATDGATVLTGTDLLTGILRFEDLGGNTSTVEFVGIDSVQSWTANPYNITRYKLALRNSDGTATPICSDATSIHDPNAWAVVISGERYDWPSKSVLASGAQGDGWFNIVCVGHGLYKMKLMGYDPEPSPASSFATTDDERQATLKMITADYCGTGTGFTENGTSLEWRNVENWSFNYTGEAGNREAVWGPTGALCLDTPRLGQSERSAIIDECQNAGVTLPPCHTIGQPTDMEWSSHVPISQ